MARIPLPPSRLPKELDLSAAFALTRKLVVSGNESAPANDPLRPGLGKGLRYWLWRLSGRRRPTMTDVSHFGRLADNYDRDLARQHARVAELEQLTGQLQAAFARKQADLQRQHADEIARLRTEHPAASPATLAEAEDRIRLAENKVELLKEALEATRARAGSDAITPAPLADTRFRDTKRAFARHFHPDQGGRDDPEKQRIFLEFWPVLEKIERDG